MISSLSKAKNRISSLLEQNMNEFYLSLTMFDRRKDDIDAISII